MGSKSCCRQWQTALLLLSAQSAFIFAKQAASACKGSPPVCHKPGSYGLHLLLFGSRLRVGVLGGLASKPVAQASPSSITFVYAIMVSHTLRDPLPTCKKHTAPPDFVCGGSVQFVKRAHMSPVQRIMLNPTTQEANAQTVFRLRTRYYDCFFNEFPSLHGDCVQDSVQR